MCGDLAYKATIGIFNNSASLITSLYLAVYFIPPPTIITGLVDWIIIFTDFFINSGWGLKVTE